MFRFQLTADMRGFHENFRSVLQYINTNGLTGEFHITAGDFDNTAPENRQVIDDELGADYLWYPIIGNHEEETTEDMTWLRDEYDYGNDGREPLANSTNNDGPEGVEQTIYSFDYENVHFVALNQYWDGISDVGTDGDIIPEQLAWLDANLAATDKPFKIVIAHEPAYPLNRHVGDSFDKYPDNRDAFWEVLVNRGVQLFLCGHTHVYSVYEKDGVWQIDAGNAGNDTTSDGLTFVDFLVDSDYIEITTYNNSTGDFEIIDSITLTIEEEEAEPETELIVTGIEFRDGGIGATFNDGSSINLWHEVSNGILGIAGGTDNQRTALTNFYNNNIDNNIGIVDLRFSYYNNPSIFSLIQDTSPQLGEFLDLNAFNIGYVYGSVPGAMDLQPTSTTQQSSYSFAAGVGNTCNSTGSFAVNAYNLANAKYSSVFGISAKSVIPGQQVLSSGDFEYSGDAQMTRTILKTNTNDANFHSLVDYDNNLFAAETGISFNIHLTIVGISSSGYCFLCRKFNIVDGSIGTVETIGTDYNSGEFVIQLSVASEYLDIEVKNSDGVATTWQGYVESMELGDSIAIVETGSGGTILTGIPDSTEEPSTEIDTSGTSGDGSQHIFPSQIQAVIGVDTFTESALYQDANLNATNGTYTLNKIFNNDELAVYESSVVNNVDWLPAELPVGFPDSYKYRCKIHVSKTVVTDGTTVYVPVLIPSNLLPTEFTSSGYKYVSASKYEDGTYRLPVDVIVTRSSPYKAMIWVRDIYGINGAPDGENNFYLWWGDDDDAVSSWLSVEYGHYSIWNNYTAGYYTPILTTLHCVGSYHDFIPEDNSLHTFTCSMSTNPNYTDTPPRFVYNSALPIGVTANPYGGTLQLFGADAGVGAGRLNSRTFKVGNSPYDGQTRSNVWQSDVTISSPMFCNSEMSVRDGLTLSLWIKRLQRSGAGSLWHGSRASGNQVEFIRCDDFSATNPAYYMTYIANGTPRTTAIPGLTMPLGVWTKIDITIRGSDWPSVYQNGEKIATLVDMSYLDFFNILQHVGDIDGYYDEIRVHTKVLSPQEIKVLYRIESSPGTYISYSDITDVTQEPTTAAPFGRFKLRAEWYRDPDAPQDTTGTMKVAMYYYNPLEYSQFNSTFVWSTLYRNPCFVTVDQVNAGIDVYPYDSGACANNNEEVTYLEVTQSGPIRIIGDP